MKYAVPIRNGTVCPYIGQCDRVFIMDIDAKSGQVTGKATVIPPSIKPGQYPKWLSGQGVAVLIAEIPDQQTAGLFRNHGIEVLTISSETDPEKTVLDHATERLKTGDTSPADQPGTNCEEYNTAF